MISVSVLMVNIVVVQMDEVSLEGPSVRQACIIKSHKSQVGQIQVFHPGPVAQLQVGFFSIIIRFFFGLRFGLTNKTMW